MLTIMRTAMNPTTNNPSPNTLMIFSAGSGHFDHSNSANLSYFSPSTMSQFDHKNPLYPGAHGEGLLSSLLYPPFQASGLGHSTATVEFCEYLQYPSSKLI